MDIVSITPPGAPGIAPRWTSSAKSAVGTALGRGSRVWFTMSHGILNEIYANRLDTACIRDFGLIVTAQDYFSEDKRDADHRGGMVEDGVPAIRVVSTARDGRYRITKTVLCDPEREVVLQEIAFEALIGTPSDYSVHAIIAPHLVNAGADNTAWYDDYKGRPMLFAEGRGTVLAIASSVPWLARSAGYVGVSDGWQTLSRGEGLRPEYQRAEKGNVAISGTVDFATGNGRAVLADRIWRATGGSGLPRSDQSATGRRANPQRLLSRMAGLAKKPVSPRRTVQSDRAQSLPRQHVGPRNASRRGLRRHHRKLVDTLGFFQGR